MYIRSPYPNELYHHGVKGQKWGVRKYQNADGSLTPEGKKHYAKDSEWSQQNKNAVAIGDRTFDRRSLFPEKHNGARVVPGPDFFHKPNGDLVLLQRYSDGTILAVDASTPKAYVYELDDRTAEQLINNYEKGEYQRQNYNNQIRMNKAKELQKYKKETAHRYDTDFDGKISTKELLSGISSDAKSTAKKILNKVSSVFNF